MAPRISSRGFPKHHLGGNSLPFAVLLASTLFAKVSSRATWLQEDSIGLAATPRGFKDDALPCSHPIPRAPVKFPEHLLSGSMGAEVVMYSGYVNVTARDYLFYIFAEADQAAAKDAPLLIWSNGGPGCSSMEGAVTEHGPLLLFNIKGRDASGKLTWNANSWNRHAHVIYVDQPRYVGFSCGTGRPVTSTVEAARDIVTFIRGWKMLFPEHKDRDVIIAAESYGGKFVAAWSSSILDHNAAAADADVINLRGIAIGNGLLDRSVQDHHFKDYALRENLIPSNFSRYQSIRLTMRQNLGYSPNYYDYRLKEEFCCGCSSYDYRPWSQWLMREDVKSALNVCGNSGAKAFDGCAAGCIPLNGFDVNDRFDYIGALGRALGKGILVTMFYGMQDTACDYVGGHAAALRIQWSGAERFRSMPLADLVISNVSTGKYKSFGGLSWIQVQGAGHMVPIDNPAAATFSINTLIFGRHADPNFRDSALRGLKVGEVSSMWSMPESAAAATGPPQTSSIMPALLVWLTASSILVVSGQWAFRYNSRRLSLDRHLSDDSEL